MYFMTFSEKLALAMKQRGVSQIQLANRLGMDSAVINRYVQGQRTPTAENLVLIADALNIKYDEILSWFKDGTPNLKKESMRERLLGLFSEMSREEQADHVDALELRMSKNGKKKK